MTTHELEQGLITQKDNFNYMLQQVVVHPRGTYFFWKTFYTDSLTLNIFSDSF